MAKHGFIAGAAGALAAFASGGPLSAEVSQSAAERILELHNHERAAHALPPLSWNPALAKAAQPWAYRLARDGYLHHSTDSDTGENLWMGTSGFFSTDQMIGAFTGERRMFRPGVFPEVSTTGSWEDVGHYTQIIWPQTQQVGCAIASSNGMDVLVCRYWPAGNWIGRPVGLAQR